MCLNHPELEEKYPTHLASSVQTEFTTSLVTRHRSSRGISCYLCAGVVRVGSMRFAVLEPPRTRENVPV